jgi:NAD(P)-dependent dehydrogenase (short-subunit alcohol dehydrogenase family)
MSDGRAGLVDGRVAVVTGVGPGLGRATALALAREGAAVALVARSADRLEQVAEEITVAGGRAIAVPASVTKPADCDRVAAAALEAFGRIDVVVNSAFRGDPFTPVESSDLDVWRKIFEVNFYGPVLMTRACLPALRAQGGGSVVMVASQSARKIRPNEAGYAASKAALITLTRSLATELAVDHIRVNAVVPGWIWGPNVQLYVDWQTQSRGISADEVIREITSEIPLGEIPPQEDIAESIVFFASGMSRMITGQTLDVNGGEFFG